MLSRLEGSPSGDDADQPFSLQGAEGTRHSGTGYSVAPGEVGNGRQRFVRGPLASGEATTKVGLYTSAGQFGRTRHASMIRVLANVRILNALITITVLSSLSILSTRATWVRLSLRDALWQNGEPVRLAHLAGREL